jgi:DNA-binding beta-propeller fold protein YncE
MARWLAGLRWCAGAGALALGSLALVTLGGGCASPPGVIFDSASAGQVWPPPPDAGRIRYIGQLRGEGDLKPGRSGLERLGETLFGKKETETFVSPMAVCTDGPPFGGIPGRGTGGDRVFIADSNGQAIHVLDMKTRVYQRWAPTEPSQRLTLPVAVAFDPEPAPGRLLVSDSVAGEIAVFDMEGKRTGTLGTGLLKRPCGIAVDAAARRIFVADAGVHQVVVLDGEGHELARVGRRGMEPGEFNFPTNVALDADGRLIVSDSLNFRVQVFGPRFDFVREIGKKGDMPGYFAQPKGVAVDPAGRIFVVDANFEAVQLFDQNGTLLMSFGHEGQGPGEFWLPAGVFADNKGRLWVADSYNKRVQVFEMMSGEEARP